ncbi:MAG: hypothetical protein RB191_18690 [Terriglobia bacterium]|nr:hypothetical protein [Terriglobia bacterium]
MRAAQQQASGLENNAASTAAGYGSSASSISSTLLPFLTRELNTPGGISQQDQTAMLSASQGGAGGLASGLQTGMNQKAAATGNESGFGSSADEIARQREKAAAGGSESIAGQNAMTKLNQQQEGARGLQGLYGTDVGAQLNSLGLQNQAIGQEVNAGSHGWFQNMTSLIAALKGGSQAPGAMPTGDMSGDMSGGMQVAGAGDEAMQGLGTAANGLSSLAGAAGG